MSIRPGSRVMPGRSMRSTSAGNAPLAALRTSTILPSRISSCGLSSMRPLRTSSMCAALTRIVRDGCTAAASGVAAPAIGDRATTAHSSATGAHGLKRRTMRNRTVMALPWVVVEAAVIVTDRRVTRYQAAGCSWNNGAGCRNGSSQWSISRKANSAIRYTME